MTTTQPVVAYVLASNHGLSHLWRRSFFSATVRCQLVVIITAPAVLPTVVFVNSQIPAGGR
jgi:hypothetical protein